MKIFLRITFLLGGIFFGIHGCLLFPWLPIPGRQSWGIFQLPLSGASLSASFLAFWVAFHLDRSRERTAAIYGAISGMSLGAVATVGGMIWGISTQLNLAPIVGIFITGPIGFIIGAVSGFAVGWFRGPSTRAKGPPPLP